MLSIDEFSFISHLCGVVTFIAVYLYSSIQYKEIGKWGATILIVLAIIAGLARIYFQHTIDGTRLYNQVIALYSQSVIGIAIFFVSRFVLDKYEKITDCFYRLLKGIDKYSLYIYLTHGMFTSGIFSLKSVSSNIFINTVLFIIFTMASSILLKTISDIFVKFLRKCAIW